MTCRAIINMLDDEFAKIITTTVLLRGEQIRIGIYREANLAKKVLLQ